MCSCCPQPLDLRIPSKRYEIINPVIANESLGDELPESDCRHLELNKPPLDQSTDFSCPKYENSPLINSCHGEDDQPDSPTSDEGFVDEQPSAKRKLPFDGNFPESTEATTSNENKKKPRKRLSSIRSQKKSAGPTPPGERRKPGRKPGQVSNVLHLWEFMRDLLHMPRTNGGIIEWISVSDGVFKVVNSAEVARLWGEKKKNKKAMTYEKLSRSLRYSRLEGYFDNLPKDKNYPKKLCFKFGPKSKDWALPS